MREYLKKLNWYGFFILLLLTMASAAANKNVSNVTEWLFLVVIFGVPASLLFLFIGKKD